MFSRPGAEDSPCRPEEKVASMDAADQTSSRPGTGGNEPCPTQKSPGSGQPETEVKEARDDTGEGGQNSLNAKADDKKKAGHQSSKYKSVSYRKIRKGNTRQRIDEFESMMNL